jgi:hypothetical protein
MAKDDIDFDAYMRDRGVQRMGSPQASRPAAPAISTSDPKLRAHLEAQQRALSAAQAERDQATGALAAMQAERDEARRELVAVAKERDQAKAALAAMQAERDEARRELSATRADRDAVAKAHAAPPVAAAPRSRPTLRQALLERGIEDDAEAAELLLALLDRHVGELLDALEARPELVERVLARVAFVCDRPECQPAFSGEKVGEPGGSSKGPVAVRVSAERCEVCGGSDIRVAFDLLLRASRRAGVTRLVVVGGSPAYHTQLRDLSRGTDLKLDLVAGHSKPGKRRARNEAERVVIWGATILDHGTSAAYEHLGDKLIRVPHRGISRMLREVADALEAVVE